MNLRGPGFVRQFPCPTARPLDTAGRQVVLGPVLIHNLQASRKIYSPGVGGFARYLEEIQNPGTSPVVVSVTISGKLCSYINTRIVVAPSLINFTYAVNDHHGFSCTPPLS